VAEGVFDSASRRHPRHCEVQKGFTRSIGSRT